MPTADELIRTLGLEPHPKEGGFFRETYISQALKSFAHDVQLARGHIRRLAVGRAPRSIIRWTPTTFSAALHRLQTDEIFHFYLGDPVRMLQLDPDGNGRTLVLGPDVLGWTAPASRRPDAASGRAATSNPAASFSAALGCTVAPGFEIRRLRNAARRAALMAQYPEFADTDSSRLTIRHDSLYDFPGGLISATHSRPSRPILIVAFASHASRFGDKLPGRGRQSAQGDWCAVCPSSRRTAWRGSRSACGCMSCHTVVFMLWSPQRRRGCVIGIAVDQKKLAEWTEWSMDKSLATRVFFKLDSKTVQSLPEALLQPKLEKLVEEGFTAYEKRFRGLAGEVIGAREELKQHQAALVKQRRRASKKVEGNERRRT